MENQEEYSDLKLKERSRVQAQDSNWAECNSTDPKTKDSQGEILTVKRKGKRSSVLGNCNKFMQIKNEMQRGHVLKTEQKGRPLWTPHGHGLSKSWVGGESEKGGDSGESQPRVCTSALTLPTLSLAWEAQCHLGESLWDATVQPVIQHLGVISPSWPKTLAGASKGQHRNPKKQTKLLKYSQSYTILVIVADFSGF